MPTARETNQDLTLPDPNSGTLLKKILSGNSTGKYFVGILASTGGTTGGAEGGVRPPKPPGELRSGASGLVAGRTLADAMLCSRLISTLPQLA